ncbi:MAG: metal-dependent transcriptional regulator [Erysipelothrix sp.]|nr:metal-dependent transcriptional regulator [Erysipelothrix sp.]
MTEQDKLTPSIEDYLEAIYVLDRADKGVRSVDVADKLHVAKPSVNRALKSLVESGLIEQQRYSVIYLTEQGKEQARKILHRHTIIKSFLMNILGLDDLRADEEACKIEHVVSEDTIKRLSDHVNQFQGDI